MGQICFTGGGNEAERAKSRQIEEELREWQRQSAKEHKILLLGPGESGKSTVFKQMKIVQDGGGFSVEERMQFRHIVHANCLSQMRVLVQACARNRQPFYDQAAYAAATQLIELPPNAPWTPEIAQLISTLWKEKGIRAMYDKSGVIFQLNDSAAYFFDGIERFIQPDYCPSLDDVLRVRVRSTGIEEAQFVFDKNTFKVMDVGGQRSERRKWLHCFDHVTAVLYCASLSCYYQVLREDATTNRMIESLNLFDDVVNAPYFVSSKIILFLNKTDLLQEKLQQGHDLKVLFPHYTGGLDFEAAAAFIEARFIERVQSRKPEEVAVHRTCAVDTNKIQYIIRKVQQFVLLKIAGELNL